MGRSGNGGRTPRPRGSSGPNPVQSKGSEDGSGPGIRLPPCTGPRRRVGWVFFYLRWRAHSKLSGDEQSAPSIKIKTRAPETRMKTVGFPFSLLTAALWTCGAAAAQPSFPVAIELDVVFPRNDTYAPVPAMPIVFALQNANKFGPLLQQLSWRLSYANESDYIDIGIVDVGDELDVNSDPYFIVLSTRRLNMTEGSWSLDWTWVWQTCLPNATSALISAHQGLQDPIFMGSIAFATKNGAKQPNLTMSDTDECSTSSAVINFASVLDLEPGVSSYNRVQSCPVQANSTPPADPCRVRVDAATASNISATMLTHLCSYSDPARQKKCLSDNGLPSSGSLSAAPITGFLFLALLSALYLN